jgi:hypothetical protein
MAQTWNDCEQQSQVQVQINAVGYRFHNALMATADHWFSILNSDESTFKQPDRYGSTVAQFFEWFRLTSRLWNDGANRTWPTQGRVEIGHSVDNSTATAAMKYFQQIADVLSDGPMADAGLYGEHEITSDRLKAFKAALVQHFTECGIPVKPADASKILDQIELNVPAEARAAGNSVYRSEVEGPRVTTKHVTRRRKRTDPNTHINKLRQKKANGYTYPHQGGYKKLVEDIGGSTGSWTKIFADPENADLLEWKDNRSVYARNSPAAEQAGYEDEEYLPDDDLLTLFADQVKNLPEGEQVLAWERFLKTPPDLQRKFIAGRRS